MLSSDLTHWHMCTHRGGEAENTNAEKMKQKTLYWVLTNLFPSHPPLGPVTGEPGKALEKSEPSAGRDSAGFSFCVCVFIIIYVYVCEAG